MTIQKLFLTFFGTGVIPKSPQAVTTLLALTLGIVVLYTLGMESLSVLTLAASIIAIFEINEYGSDQVTINYAIGVWLALMVSHNITLSLTYPYVKWLAVFVTLVSFCLFMRWKPSTIGWIEQNIKGGLGVIGSALLAGFAGGFLTILILLGVDKLF
jgi:phosphatidylglycerophosphatase A